MKWQYKAKIMNCISRFPYSENIYKWLQRKFGRLNVNPMDRLPVQLKMAQCLLDAGYEIEGKSFFEVGTGHIPVVPIGFFLCGAESVSTVDLHRRMDWGLLRETLFWFVSNRTQVEELYQRVVRGQLLSSRLDMIEKYVADPELFLRKASIIYLAPADGGDTGLPACSIDYHFSCTVLEHVPLLELQRIFAEAKRILTLDGKLIHYIDPSDHFQHQDYAITKVNFLRFSNKDWSRIAGNPFAYCNRLRMSDYIHLFSSLGYAVEQLSSSIDQESLESLSSGFQLAEEFSAYQFEDICAMDVNVLFSKIPD